MFFDYFVGLHIEIKLKERYLAILYPLKAKYTCTRQRAKLIIILIWAVSFVLAAPLLIGKVDIDPSSSTEEIFFHNIMFKNKIGNC